MRIGYVQFEPVFGEVAHNLDVMERLIRGAGEADLLVAPELATSGYTFVSREEAFELAEFAVTSTSLGRLAALAAERSCAIVAGFPERAGEEVYNASVLILPDGTRRIYRKIHLFAAEHEWFAPGDRPFEVWDAAGTSVGMMICFDWIFPESARMLALGGARILCHPANLVLPWCQRSMPTRSIENRVFTVTANRVGTEERGPFSHTFTGASQVTAPDGAVLASAPVTGESVGIVAIDPGRATDKRLNEYNDLIADRRPTFYDAITGCADARSSGNNG